MNELTNIQQRIHEIRGQRVMLDFDLAQAYGVETRRLNEQVKRNIERFPEDFMFQLTRGEWEILRSQIATTNVIENEGVQVLRSQNATAKHQSKVRSLPYAFTELGVAMLSSVLRSPIAIQVNIGIMRTFFQMRQAIATLSVPDTQEDIRQLRADFEELKSDIEDILRDQNDINDDTRAQLDAIATALAELQQTPKTPRRKIGFVQD